jgi:hypothetical protein
MITEVVHSGFAHIRVKGMPQVVKSEVGNAGCPAGPSKTGVNGGNGVALVSEDPIMAQISNFARLS